MTAITQKHIEALKEALKTSEDKQELQDVIDFIKKIKKMNGEQYTVIIAATEDGYKKLMK